MQCIEEAVEKIESALEIDPRKHEALWCLGNAYTSQGFLHATVQKAQEYFDRAQDCFKKALKEEPNNEVYVPFLLLTPPHTQHTLPSLSLSLIFDE